MKTVTFVIWLVATIFSFEGPVIFLGSNSCSRCKYSFKQLISFLYTFPDPSTKKEKEIQNDLIISRTRSTFTHKAKWGKKAKPKNNFLLSHCSISTGDPSPQSFTNTLNAQEHKLCLAQYQCRVQQSSRMSMWHVPPCSTAGRPSVEIIFTWQHLVLWKT